MTLAATRPTIDAVLRAVEVTFEVDRAVLVGRDRTRDTAHVRQFAMLAAYRLTDATLEAIGRALGGRHHPTVIHGIQRVEMRMDLHPELARDLEAVRRRSGVREAA